MTEFTCGTRVLAGTGAVAALKALAPRRLLIVSDPFFEKNGTARRLAEISGAEEVEIFSRVAPDPSVVLAAEGTARITDFRPDTVVALGGGSAMDLAKAMVYFGDLPVRLVAVPTTSGSGSEVTDFAILTHDGVKHPLVDPRLRPEIAILDDGLLSELPRGLVADTGFDVISHAVEAFVGKNGGPFTDALAKDSFCAVLENLPASFAGDRSVRLGIHQASAMAGLAFTQAGLGLCHALAHALGGRFHVPHGRLNAILLPAVISCNAYGAGEKYAALARAAGLGGSADTIAVRNLKNALIRLRKDLELPDTLARAGVPLGALWQQREGILASALADPCCGTNPVPVTAAMARQVLEEVSGGGR